jgi:DNA-binding protein WhiA
VESFSHKTKLRICAESVQNESCCRAELLGLICFSGIVVKLPGKEELGLKIMLETEEIAERICLELAQLYDISPAVSVKNNKLTLYLADLNDIRVLKNGLKLEEDDGILYLRIDPVFLQSGEEKKALIRGAFLGGGSVSNPEKSYHLEFATRSFECAQTLVEVIGEFGIEARITTRKTEVVVYIKENEAIADLLGLLGASASLMEIYNTVILKEMRNDVNRKLNCETANLSKTADASARQILAIQSVLRAHGEDFLSPELREIARVRLEFPEASLKELGEMLSPPIGKSGANHRLKKIIEIAQSIGGSKQERMDQNE